MSRLTTILFLSLLAQHSLASSHLHVKKPVVKHGKVAKHKPHVASKATSNKERCLATAIWHEARGVHPKYQKVVGNVILNRGSDPCSVIKQKGQFPWAGVSPNNTSEESLSIAREMLIHRVDNTKGATFFNNKPLKFSNPEKVKYLGKVGPFYLYKERL